MRQITIDAIRAFRNNYPFKRSNTQVICYGNTHFKETMIKELRLFNNVIAVCDVWGNLYITDAGHQSVTTKERLNGLPNVHIVQKNFVWYLNGEAWNGDLIKVEW
tara:strand:+ start:1705 stop:2019 length:315 start_codon:yes stop_codon:yes gene_type:complete